MPQTLYFLYSFMRSSSYIITSSPCSLLRCRLTPPAGTPLQPPTPPHRYPFHLLLFFLNCFVISKISNQSFHFKIHIKTLFIKTISRNSQCEIQIIIKISECPNISGIINCSQMCTIKPSSSRAPQKYLKHIFNNYKHGY